MRSWPASARPPSLTYDPRWPQLFDRLAARAALAAAGWQHEGDLGSHPAAAARYAALKHQLAPLLATDRAAYVTGKADLIAELLAMART